MCEHWTRWTTKQNKHKQNIKTCHKQTVDTEQVYWKQSIHKHNTKEIQLDFNISTSSSSTNSQNPMCYNS